MEEPTRLLRPCNFPGKSTGVGCHFLLQGIFPTQGSNPGLPHCRQTLCDWGAKLRFRPQLSFSEICMKIEEQSCCWSPWYGGWRPKLERSVGETELPGFWSKPFLHETPGPRQAHQTACAWLTGTDPRRWQQNWGFWRGAPGALGVENSERCCQGSHLCRDQEWDFSPIMQRKEMKRRLCLGQGCCVGDSQHQHTHQCSSF